MAQLPSSDHQEVIRRLSSELLDAYDEELEMEIEDHHALPDGEAAAGGEGSKDYRREYFQQLFRLQAELVLDHR